MDAAFTALCDAVVPDVVADALEVFAQHTGLRWGVMSRAQYWYQPPKVHVGLCVLMLAFSALLYRHTRGFKSNAVAWVAGKGVGRSVRCPINKLIAYVLVVCFCAQLYTKGSRPKPLVQLAWMLMPCHIFTGLWIYIFLHDKPQHYGLNCYLATLMIDWLWAPIGAAVQPDFGDHHHFWERYMFFIHHGLLFTLPFYYAARYDTLKLSWPHILHLTWVPTFVNFALFTPYALFIGLNVNYQLAPPPLGSKAPAVFRTVLFRPAFVVAFAVLSVLMNVVTRLTGSLIRGIFSTAQSVKRKVM